MLSPDLTGPLHLERAPLQALGAFCSGFGFLQVPSCNLQAGSRISPTTRTLQANDGQTRISGLATSRSWVQHRVLSVHSPETSREQVSCPKAGFPIEASTMFGPCFYGDNELLVL